MNNITILGSGFAAVTALKKVRALDPEAHITLIAPRAEFIYLPGLIWIPSGLRSEADLRLSLDPLLKRERVHFMAGEVQGLKEGGRIVVTDNGELSNDGLIIATGGRFIKKLPGIEHAITPCEGIEAAVRIRDRLRQLQSGTIAIGFGGNPKEPSAMRGGPMFEFLFGIDTQLRQEGRRDRFKLIFFNPSPQPGQRLGPKAVAGLKHEMAKRGIETHLGHKIKGFEPQRVNTEGGGFAADLILFMPGMTGSHWFDNSELPLSPGGMVVADEMCLVQGCSRVYVAGDSGSFPGPEWMPKQAHIADIQAGVAAENLLSELAGRSPQRRFKVELICIVDSLNSGILVFRNFKWSLVLPSSRFWHWSKRLFEWWYLRQFR